MEQHLQFSQCFLLVQVLVYNASTDTWSKRGTMERGRWYHAIVEANLRVVCFGKSIIQLKTNQIFKDIFHMIHSLSKELIITQAMLTSDSRFITIIVIDIITSYLPLHITVNHHSQAKLTKPPSPLQVYL